MKKINLDVKRLQLKKIKIANLTDDGMTRIMGGDSEESGDECKTGPTTSMACTRSCGTTCYTCPPPPPPPSAVGCPTVTSILYCY